MKARKLAFSNGVKNKNRKWKKHKIVLQQQHKGAYGIEAVSHFSSSSCQAAEQTFECQGGQIAERHLEWQPAETLCPRTGLWRSFHISPELWVFSSSTEARLPARRKAEAFQAFGLFHEKSPWVHRNVCWSLKAIRHLVCHRCQSLRIDLMASTDWLSITSRAAC